MACCFLCHGVAITFSILWKFALCKLCLLFKILQFMLSLQNDTIAMMDFFRKKVNVFYFIYSVFTSVVINNDQRVNLCSYLLDLDIFVLYLQYEILFYLLESYIIYDLMI